MEYIGSGCEAAVLHHWHEFAKAPLIEHCCCSAMIIEPDTILIPIEP